MILTNYIQLPGSWPFARLITTFSAAIITTCMLFILLPEVGYAGQTTKSKRIEVYTLSQSYWDTKSGDTLSEIVVQLLPNNPSKHDALQRDIVNLNPNAFINADPARLLADRRLRLPGYMKQADSKIDPESTTVEPYSWGNIKRAKE